MTHEEIRSAVLKAIYDCHHSNNLPQWSSYFAAELASASGDSTITFAIVDNALDYLVGKYLIETRELSGPRGIKPHHLVLSIRASGMDLVEKPTATKPSAKRQQNVHFNAPVASVQIGDNTVANVTQYLDANMDALTDALVALRDAAAARPGAEAVRTLASEAASEANQERTLTDRLRGLLTGIALLVPTLGESVPAYHAVQLAASAMGHPLPALPSLPQ